MSKKNLTRYAKQAFICTTKLNFLKVDVLGGDILGAAQESDQHHRGPKIGEGREYFIRPYHVRAFYPQTRHLQEKKQACRRKRLGRFKKEIQVIWMLSSLTDTNPL